MSAEASVLVEPHDARVLLELCKTVDCIQDGSPIFIDPQAEASYLSDVFPDVIRKVRFAAVGLTPALQAENDQALQLLYEEPPFVKKAAYAEFCALRSDIALKECKLLEQESRIRAAQNSDEKDSLSVVGDELAKVVHNQRELLASLDRQYMFSQAEEILERADHKRSAIPKSVLDALSAIDLFKIGDPISNETHVSASLFPSAPAEDSWTRVRLTGEDIFRYQPSPRTPSRRAFPAEAAVDGLGTISDDEISSVEFQIQCLSVERQWFWPGLLGNRYWNWESSGDAISDGMGHGQIPAYVVGIILLRNVVVLGTRRTATGTSGSLSASGAMPLRTIANLLPSSDLQFRRVDEGETGQRRYSISQRQQFQVQREPFHMRRVDPRIVEVMRRVNMLSSQLRGRVTDQGGNGIYGAKLWLQIKGQKKGQQTLTGRGGDYMFSRIPRGEYMLVVHKPGFGVFRKGIEVGDPLEFPVVLVREQTRASLTIEIAWDHGDPAEVSLREANIFVRGSATGLKRFEGLRGNQPLTLALPPGEYVIAASSPSAWSVEPPRARMNVTGDERLNLKFLMRCGVLLQNPQMQVVGFICRRVPKCPDPDPSALFP